MADEPLRGKRSTIGTLEKGIVGALLTDSGRRTMPWQQGDVVPQCEDLLSDGRQQSLMITAREVSATDGTLKDHIADDRKPPPTVKEDHMPRGMPGTMPNLHDLIAKSHLIPMIQPAVGHECLAGREADLSAPFGQAVEKKTICFLRAFDRQTQFTGHATHDADVVEMAMRDQNPFQLNPC